MMPVPDLRRQIQHLSISDPFKNLGTLAPASSARGVDTRANRSSKFRRSEEVKKIDRNYVVQCLLCQNVPWATATILNQLEGHHGSLSIQKYSSNVVEKCLKHVQEVHRDKIISELINNPQLHQISQDQFGNYVIQTALKESKDISLQLSAVVEPSQSEQGTCTSSIVSDLESSVSVSGTCASSIANDVEPSEPDINVHSVHTKSQLKGIDTGVESCSQLFADPHENEITSAPDKIGELSPPLSERLREISNSLKLLSSKPICVSTPQDTSCTRRVTVDHADPKTPGVPFYLRLDDYSRIENIGTPQDMLKTRSTGLKKSLLHECLSFLNTANKEELKQLKGIGEKRATYILEWREESPEPFKNIDDLKLLGLSQKEIRGLVTDILGEF